jgi:hypothetical protein
MPTSSDREEYRGLFSRSSSIRHIMKWDETDGGDGKAGSFSACDVRDIIESG